MLKVLNPQGKEIDENLVYVPMYGCICNGELQNYSFTRDLGPGCWCSCVGVVNRDANANIAIQK